MSDFFTFGPTGNGVAVDPSGRIIAQDGRATGAKVFGYGNTGRPMLVDDLGRLIISVQSASGTVLPDPALYNYGDRFYLIHAVNGGFYMRGISNWEGATVATPSGEVNTGSSLGNGVPVFSDKAGYDLQFHSLGAGSGIKLTLASEKITIDNKVTRALDMSITDVGNYYPTHNVNAALQTIGAGNAKIRTDFDNASGVMVSATATAQAKADGVRIDFDNASGIFQAKVASISSAGGTTLVKSATGVLKGLTAGTGVILTGETNDVKIDVKDFANASGLFVKSAVSAGGTSIIKTGTAPNLSFKGVTAGSGISIVPGTNANTFHAKAVSNFDLRHDDQQCNIQSAGGIAALTTEAYLDTPFLMPFFRHGQDDSIYVTLQMSHRRIPGSIVDSLHLHYIPMAAPGALQKAYFRTRYTFVKIGTAVPALSSWTTVFTWLPVVASHLNINYIHNLASGIAAPANDGPSSLLLAEITRLGTNPQDTYNTNKTSPGTNAANLGLVSVDAHLDIDRLGSISELTDQ